jgi:hypothetical protein
VVIGVDCLKHDYALSYLSAERPEPCVPVSVAIFDSFEHLQSCIVLMSYDVLQLP